MAARRPIQSVVLIPRTPPSPDHLHAIVERYKKLRLYGLQANPKAFTSTYERESQFTPEEWIARIQNPVVRTFVSVIGDNGNLRNGDGINLSAGDDLTDPALRLLLEKEWMGKLTLVGPELLLSAQGEDESALSRPWEVFLNYVPPKSAQPVPREGAHFLYLVVGMFVSPQARRRGSGQRLLEAAIKAAREEAQARGALTARIVINVAHENGIAQRLYERLGFEVGDNSLELNSRGQTSRVVAMVKVIDITEDS